MAEIKIISIELAPIVPQTGNIKRVAREVASQQTSLLRPKACNPYTSYREESITYRETATGTYEPILGNDPVILERASRIGQMVDIWI